MVKMTMTIRMRITGNTPPTIADTLGDDVLGRKTETHQIDVVVFCVGFSSVETDLHSRGMHIKSNI